MNATNPIQTDANEPATAKPAASAAGSGSEDLTAEPRPARVQSQQEAVDEALADVASAEPGDEEVHAQLQSLQADLADAEARVLRAHAELENYRKRANRHLEEEKKYAPLALMRDLLPVLDNLERAIQSAGQDGGSAQLVEGVKMVAQLLVMTLERHHCRRIEAQGAVFDPHVHEAIAQIPSDQVPPGTVLEVAQTGYQLHDRVVRPSQVLVSGRPAAAGAAGANE